MCERYDLTNFDLKNSLTNNVLLSFFCLFCFFIGKRNLSLTLSTNIPSEASARPDLDKERHKYPERKTYSSRSHIII